MAKAQEIEIDPAEPYAAAAARIVRVRADELFERSEGVLDTEDIERVHAMRVASRRLRAVLEIFAPCFPTAEHRDVLRDVKRLADALGERRDPDVHIDAMQRLEVAVAPEQRPGIQDVVRRLRRRQQDGNRQLEDALEDADGGQLHRRLRALADHAAPDART
jgi:CHAD domain-containing protein